MLGLLETPAIARRFGRLAVAELDSLRRWIGEAGIRWGLDANDRAARGLPAETAHSWKFGLERLFLGLAMPDDDTLRPHPSFLRFHREQVFKGMLFTGTGKAIAGTSRMVDREAGFYATREE